MPDYKVNYFKLENNGDCAIVRFPYSSTDQFESVYAHTVTDSSGKWPKIKCLRQSYTDSIELCPLCNSGKDQIKAKKTFFVKLLNYIPDGNGGQKAQACIWTRPLHIDSTSGKYTGFAGDLASYIEEYGDLSKLIFKIKRNGEANDLKTTYTLTVLQTEKYPATIYKPDFSDFNDFDLLKNKFYYEKSVDDMNKYLITGTFFEAKQTFTPSVTQTTPTIPTGDPYAPTPGVTISNTSTAQLNTAEITTIETPVTTQRYKY